MHAEPTIAAAEAGKHVLCEKPLGRDADEAYEIWSRVAATGVKHLCGFNYRFVPAVRLARELIEAGELGEIRHFRRATSRTGPRTESRHLALQPRGAPAGAIGDLATHVVDLARFLVGEIAALSGLVKTFVPGRKVDDAIEAPSSSTAARSARSRRRDSRSGAGTRSSGRSTARRARSASTWSA